MMSAFDNDAFMFGVARKGTSWDEAIEENGYLEFCGYNYGPDNDLPAAEVFIEGEDYESAEELEICPYPQKPSDYNFHKWFSQYVKFINMAEEEPEILNIPLNVTDEDGFFVFAVGYPFENHGLPSVDIFYAGYDNNGVEHFTWDVEEPCEEVLFQEGSFLFAILSKLKMNGALRESIDIYRFFEDFDIVKRNRYYLEQLCEL